MSLDQYSQTPASNDLANYFQTGMAPSKVKNAGWDIMADLAQFMALPTAGGSANAQTITNTRACAAWFTGMWVCWMPQATNTAAMTIQPDGLAAKNVFANGAAALAGQVVLGIPAIGRYDGTQVQLINPQASKGAYTGTYTGGATAPTGSINYMISADGSTCTLRIPGSTFTATSNAATFTITGGPAIISPTNYQGIFIAVEDATTDTFGSLNMTGASSVISLGKTAMGAGGFTSSGTKAVGHGGPFNVSYSLIS